MATTFEKFYALQIPEVRDLFIEAIRDVSDNANIEEMIKAIETNDIDQLVQASGYNVVVLNQVIDKIEDIYERTGNMMVEGWPKLRNAFGLVTPVFNIRNPSVERELSEFSSRFIKEISDEMRKSIQETLTDGIIRGINPRETAINIVGRYNPTTHKRVGGTIGLASNQVKWVNSARVYLQNLDERYFTLGLRDKRFDSIVKKAIAEGKKLTKEKISQLVTAYESRALKYRADAIARTETIQAMNRAERAALAQNIDEGLITPDLITKYWSNSADERVRLSHVDLGRKYDKNNQITFNEPFETMTGSKLLYPGDTSLGADPSEIIHCRCRCIYHIDFVKGVKNGKV